MNLCEWSKAWEIGEESIDAQHRRWVHLVNVLYSALMAGRAQETLEPLLEEVARYTKVHFETEQRLMREAEYPDYPNHLAIHTAFAARVGDLRDELATGSPLTTLVMQALWEWLVNHIRLEDQKLGTHLRNRNMEEMHELNGERG